MKAQHGESIHDIGKLLWAIANRIGDPQPKPSQYAHALGWGSESQFRRATNAAAEGRDSGKTGGVSLLSQQQLKEVDEYVDKRIKVADNPTQTDVIEHIADTFDVDVDFAWMTRWKQSRGDLHLKNGRFLEAKHVIAMRADNLKSHFDDWKEARSGVPDGLLANVDETWLCPSGQKGKVLTRKDCPIAWRRDPGKAPPHITLVAAITPFAPFPPMFIVDVDKLPIALFEKLRGAKFFVKTGKKNSRVVDKLTGSTIADRTAWMTHDTWRYVVSEIIIPHYNDLRTKEKLASDTQACLMTDGHESRDNVDALEQLRANNIALFKMRPNMTMGVQPLDCYGFKLFKLDFRRKYTVKLKEWEKWNVEQDKKDRLTSAALLRCTLIEAGLDAYQSSFTLSTCKKCWQESGAHPVNPSKLKERGFDFEIDPKLVEAVEEKKRKRKMVSVAHGIMNSQENIMQLRNARDELRVQPKKRKK